MGGKVSEKIWRLLRNPYLLLPFCSAFRPVLFLRWSGTKGKELRVGLEVRHQGGVETLGDFFDKSAFFFFFFFFLHALLPLL